MPIAHIFKFIILPQSIVGVVIYFLCYSIDAKADYVWAFGIGYTTLSVVLSIFLLLIDKLVKHHG